MSMNKGQAVGLIEREIERFIASSFGKRQEEVVPVSASGLNGPTESVMENAIGLTLQSMIAPWFQNHVAEHPNCGSVRSCYICGQLWNEVERKYGGNVRGFVHEKIRYLLAELELMG